MKIAALCSSFLGFALLYGCQSASGPDLSASEVSILAPLPGRSAAVAYLTMHNNTMAPVVVHAIRSPQYERVEMHQTTVEDGIARMSALPSVTIAVDGAVRFVSGGRHIMLMRPLTNLQIGDIVTLELHFGTDGVLILRSPLTSRTSG